ncbi:hypothetical protein Q1695_001355 [Nippostrongylus brasiliensis]|nr:hypothetical protein Q1695_001355 [Nippostrongylus brasiliensis]
MENYHDRLKFSSEAWHSETCQNEVNTWQGFSAAQLNISSCRLSFNEQPTICHLFTTRKDTRKCTTSENAAVNDDNTTAQVSSVRRVASFPQANCSFCWFDVDKKR